MINKNDVFSLLSELGIPHDAKLTVHTSLRSIGEIEGGADGLIDAFCEYLHDGIFIVPTHTWANVNRKSPVFKVLSTKPCIGTLPEVAAFRPDGVRSLHPTHSVTAFGNGAEDYVKGEERFNTPAPADCALSRLRHGGYILLIGVGHERNTFIHAVDELLNIPNRLDPSGFDITVIDSLGKEHTVKDFHPHKTEGIDCGSSEYFPKYKRALERLGAVKYAMLGGASVCCCNAYTTFAAISALWKMTGCDVCFMDREFSDGLISSVEL